MPGPALGRQPHPGDALLGRLDEIEPARVVDGDAEPADLADRLGAPLEQLRVLVDQPVRAVRAAGLLVGDERQHDVPRRAAALAEPLPDDREDHRVHVLHVDRAAPPDAAVGDLPAERVVGPVARR